jgi:4,5:9,10-diseco-3-hydroxy-5,9,17-trioxoandrosta-1(10),2-diene-4-oate hydrolase
MSSTLDATVEGAYVTGEDGVRLHYTEIGAGRPLVWLHGAGPGASGMSNFVRNVGAFDGFRNLVFDFPRYGRSDKPIIPAGDPVIAYNARQIAAALDALGVAGACFVGNSLGGGVATKIAIDRPDLVDRLVLMAGAGTRPDDEEGLSPGLTHLFAWFTRGGGRAEVEAFVRTQVHDPSVITEALIDERWERARDPETVATNPDSGMVPGDLKPELHRVAAPTLLLWGREDRVIPLHWGLELLRGIDDATLHVIPHCGHWIQYEHPDRFNRLVREFLEVPA